MPLTETIDNAIVRIERDIQVLHEVVDGNNKETLGICTWRLEQVRKQLDNLIYKVTLIKMSTD